DIRRLLQTSHFCVDSHLLDGSDPAELASYKMVVFDATHDSARCLTLCQRLHTQSRDGCLPMLFITADPSPVARLASLEMGADAYLLHPFEPPELLAQVRALL